MDGIVQTGFSIGRRKAVKFSRDALVTGMACAATSVAQSARANLPPGAHIRGYAQGPYGLVHFHDAGGNGVPLILCPQAPQTARSFDLAIPELLKHGIRGIAIDTPGFGMSDAPDFVPTIEDYAKAIPPVLDQLGLMKVDILGHHTGCLIATEVALQFPGRVGNLIMNGPLPMTDEERAQYLEGNKRTEQNFEYMDDGSHLMESFQGRFKYYGPGADAKIITRLMVEKFMGYGPFWYGHHAAFVYDHNKTIPKVNHRTLILTNTGDAIYQNAQWTHEMRPDFAYTELEGGGIDITDQKPAEWARAVASFLINRT